MQSERKVTLGRRQFFRALGGGAAAGAIGSVATPALADDEKSDDKRKPRYRESDQVKTYYRVNRYPR